MIDGHGDDIYRYRGLVKHNFSTNIPTEVSQEKLMAHLAGRASLISSYPEPEPFELERAIARQEGVEPENLLVTNGATEAMYLIAAANAGKVSAITAPSFAEYADACRLHSHTVIHVGSPFDSPRQADLIWICNPNNPTGEHYDVARLDRLIDSRPDSLHVIDAAYADYTLLPTHSAADVVSRPNILLLRSLTKRFAVPGLRIGYVTGHRETVDMLRARRMPWSVNALAIEAAGYLLDHQEDYPIDAEGLHREALFISHALSHEGLKVTPTSCNFILCELPGGTAASLKEYLVTHHGILIRDASNFTGLSERHFRVAAQNHDRNLLLIKAISEWMH